MLHQYRWLNKGNINESPFKRRQFEKTDELKKQMHDSDSVSSLIQSSFEDSEERKNNLIPSPKNSLHKNMKYVVALRKNSLLKSTLLGKILNLKIKDNFEFISQKNLKENIESKNKHQSFAKNLFQETEESYEDDDWIHNNSYEENWDGKSDYSPLVKDNKQIIEEFKLISNRDISKVRQFKVGNDPIAEKSEPESEQNNGDELLLDFKKLKTMERKKTPAMRKSDLLETPCKVNIKKSSTNLLIDDEVKAIQIKKPKRIYLVKQFRKILKKSRNTEINERIIKQKINLKIEQREKHYEATVLMLINEGETDKLIDLLKGAAIIQETILSRI